MGIPLPPARAIGPASSILVASEGVASEDITKTSAPMRTAAAVRIQANAFTKTS